MAGRTRGGGAMVNRNLMQLVERSGVQTGWFGKAGARQDAAKQQKSADADASKPHPRHMPNGLKALREWAKQHGFQSKARSESELRERLCKEMGF